MHPLNLLHPRAMLTLPWHCSCVTLQHQLNTPVSGQKRHYQEHLPWWNFRTDWTNLVPFCASAWCRIIFNLHRMKSSHDSLTSVLCLPSLLRLKLPKLLHLPNLWSKAKIVQKSHIIQCFLPPSTHMHTEISTHCSPNRSFALLHDLDKPFLPISYSGLKAPILEFSCKWFTVAICWKHTPSLLWKSSRVSDIQRTIWCHVWQIW